MRDEPADYPMVEQNNEGKANQFASVVIDNGKYMAVVVILAVICGFCANVSWRMQNDFRNESIAIQDQYQKERNHVIELEARQKVLADELQELKHERR